ncbi:tail fiber protein [Hafnia paralvei]|uniref:tail fiber protein n=1 Tax=Hafnia paralvei TaxID=546367 RepID=UPI0024A8F389|nr:tail fiber protein [Hafnia paralvei]
MSQTTITLTFEQWKAQQAIDGKAVVLDEFVLANVPNLDIDSPIDRAEQLPAAQHIVHRQAVSATGLVNENAVVYSVTMGTEVGDFSFNWVGLINKATGTLAMIVHAPLQSKIKNAEGKQGNVLTRSFLMEYNGAASETQITTPAETWQIDFTARLSGMDERQRLENVDLYGAAAFFGDGFLVTRAASQYSITQGIGYVGGLRCQLPATQNITVTTKPVKVWADVCWKGTLTSVWAEELKITVANTLANYVQDGVQHYVFAVASIDANGVITDLRLKGALSDQQANDALKKHEQSRNHPDGTVNAKGFVQLSSATNSTSETLAATPKAVKEAYDLANGKYTAQDATTNQKGIVQLSSATNSTSETLAATPKAVKAAYDKATEADKNAKTADENAGKANENANTRLEKNKNLSDLSDKPLARKNLELGTAATSNVQKSATDDTANALMANGAWGIGSSGLILKNTDLLSANGVGNAFFVQGGGTDNHFGSYGAGVHLSYGTGGGNTLRLSANLFVDPTGNLSVEWLEINRSDGSVRTQKLQKLYGSLNKPTARDVEAIPYFGQIPAGTNLNTLTNYGVWFNPANANATLALNYPSTQAGSLQILQDAGSTQIYTEYASGRQFRRGLYTGTWNPWRVVYDSLNKPNSDDVNAIYRDSCHVAGFVNGNKILPYMRHTDSNDVIQLLPISTADTRYIQNLQMGAEEYVDIPYPGQANIPLGACINAIIGTTKSTGSGISFHISRVYFRRVQKYIGGSWKNIA